MPNENSNAQKTADSTATPLMSQDDPHKKQETKKYSLGYRFYRKLRKCTTFPLAIGYIALFSFHSHFYRIVKSGYKKVLETSPFPKMYFENSNVEELDPRILRIIIAHLMMALYALFGELIANEIAIGGSAIIEYFKFIFTFRFQAYEEMFDKMKSLSNKIDNQTNENSEFIKEATDGNPQSRPIPKNYLLYICNFCILFFCFKLMSGEIEAIKANYSAMNYLLSIIVTIFGFAIFSLVFEVDQVVFIMRFFASFLSSSIILYDSNTFDQFYPVHYSQIDSDVRFEKNHLDDTEEGMLIMDFFKNEIVPILKENEFDAQDLYRFLPSNRLCFLAYFRAIGRPKIGIFPEVFYETFYLTNSIDKGKLELHLLLQMLDRGYNRYLEHIGVFTSLLIFLACPLYLFLTYKRHAQNSSAEDGSILGYGLGTYNYAKAFFIFSLCSTALRHVIKIFTIIKLHNMIFAIDMFIIQKHPEFKDHLIQNIIDSSLNNTTGIYPIYFPFYDLPSPYHRISRIESASAVLSEN